MRARSRVVAFVGFVLLAGAPLVACFDLFHGTSFEDACEQGAAACSDAGPAAPTFDAAPEAGDAGPTDFCAWDASAARSAAVRSCAWLGACAGAVADDAFGPCFVRAMLAYDCAANPNRPVRGAAHAYWDCLAKAKTCGDVRACVEPSQPRGSCSDTAAGYAGCETAANAATFIACDAGVASGSPPAALESCAGLGQTCLVTGANAVCSGASSACTSSTPYCDGAGALHDCDLASGIDHGVDCTSFGAGTCATGAVACGAVGDAGCQATSAVQCNASGVASGCPSAVLEQVDCVALGLACNADAGGRAWDVSRACSVGACGDAGDSCSNAGVVSCARGATVGVDCASVGLGACFPVTYPGDAVPHAQCGLPVGN